MNEDRIAAKLHMPPLRPAWVRRPRISARLDAGKQRKLSLVSAAAGFGKTTAVCEWLSGLSVPVAWLSIDEGDNDPVRFVTCLAASLSKAGIPVGDGLFGLLQSPERPSMESLVAILTNAIAADPDPLIVVLDDYHVVRDASIDAFVSRLLDRQPPQMHFVIITREEPRLPLSRLRVRDQVHEVRASDLRFDRSETSDFFFDVMGVSLSPEQVDTLGTATEGWIAGLQLAGLSMQGHANIEAFIRSFNGGHRYVLDYLVEEVLQKVPGEIQRFLLRTSILDRICGPLCDAVAGTDNGRETLAYLERSNLFVIPLDNDRNWYRYHHLFGDLLRKRLKEHGSPAELHRRASTWFEDNGLMTEALHHAAEAGDVDRAARLIEGDGMPMHFRGAAFPVINWMRAQPAAVLDKRPSLWVNYASALLIIGRLPAVEQTLRKAEAALRVHEPPSAIMRDLTGHIASVRASLAVTRDDADTIMSESRRALELLDAGNLPVRTAATWTLGYGYALRGDRAGAEMAYREAMVSSESIGHQIIAVMSTLGLGQIHEADGRLSLAMDTYRKALALAGNPPLPVACEAHLGIGRICYEWNDLESAERHGRLSVDLARQIETADRVMAGELFLVRLLLARGDKLGASAMLNKLEDEARRRRYMNLLPHMEELRAKVMLLEGNLTEGVRLAERNIPEDRIRALLLQAVAHAVKGEKNDASAPLFEALALAAAERYCRSFLDWGAPMAELLEYARARGVMPDYAAMLSAGFPMQRRRARQPSPLVEPLSKRELEILRCIAQGYSNEEIARELYLALSTVKGHIRNLFDKLQVKRRTEAVALARKLGIVE